MSASNGIGRIDLGSVAEKRYVRPPTAVGTSTGASSGLGNKYLLSNYISSAGIN